MATAEAAAVRSGPPATTNWLVVGGVLGRLPPEPFSTIALGRLGLLHVAQLTEVRVSGWPEDVPNDVPSRMIER
jgi:hypothetical protein